MSEEGIMINGSARKAKSEEAKTFQRNAKGVREVLNMKFEILPFEGAWYDAFGIPERRGVWFIWGNAKSYAVSDALHTTVWKKAPA